MKSKSSILILVVVVLLVVGGLVYFFTKGSGDSTKIPATLATGGLVSSNTGQNTGTSVSSTGVSSTGDQVVSLLRNLSTIQLSDAIFQHPGFVLLRDITITLPPVTSQGRRNPFAPVSGDNAVMPTTQLTLEDDDTTMVTDTTSETSSASTTAAF